MAPRPTCSQKGSGNAKKQLEILDGILTELAIQNAEEVKTPPSGQGSEVQHDSAGNTTEDRTQEHLVCH